MAQNIVIDNGSGVLKAGFAGDNAPSVKFPSIVGRPRTDKQLIGTESKSEYVGDEAQKMRGVLKLNYPIESGIVKSWDDMEKVWEYAFTNELRVDPAEHRVLLTEAPNNPKANRAKMTTIMFESFGVAGLYVAIQAVLSLYANGRTTGLVVDSGDGVTHTVPVFEGFSIPHAVKKNFIAGRVITDLMSRQLSADGIAETGGKGAWQQIVGKRKETVCFVALDYEATLETSKKSNELQKAYELPDGQTVNINAPRFMAPEGLFRPDLVQEGSENQGMHELAQGSIEECDLDIRLDLFGNVILSGGSTLYAGLPDRLAKQLKEVCNKPDQVNIVAPADRYYSVWTGGSTLCSLATFETSWITKEDYEESGADVVHRKCQ